MGIQKGVKYSKSELISYIKKFNYEFGRIPIQKDFENLDGYPSRRSFTNYFNDFNEAVRLAGFEPDRLSFKERKQKYTRDFLIGELYRFVEEFNKIPTAIDFDSLKTYPCKKYYQRLFGSWNIALKEAGLPLNSVSNYSDEFLESEFHRFVQKKGRIPTYAEFNTSEYPSFWCYQNRFGSME